MDMPKDLIDIAEHLARLDAGRPRQASLRRAISTAYYAVFHSVAQCCADTFVGWKKPYDLYSPIYRSVDHARAKKVFKEFTRGDNAGLASIGHVFVELQEQRHIADYDPEPRIGRNEVLGLVDRARSTVAEVRGLSADDKLKLSTQLIGRSRLP